MTEPVAPHRDLLTEFKAIVQIDRGKINLHGAAMATSGLLVLLAIRLVIGPVVFTAGVAVFVTALFALHARFLWKVFLFVVIYGTLVTVVAQHVATDHVVALLFLWLVSFVSGLAILMPVTNAVITIINLWAVVAMAVTPLSGPAKQSAASWLVGTAIAIGGIWHLRRRRAKRMEDPEQIDFTRASFEIHPAIRKHVLIFALGRATAVAAAGAVGVLFFPGNRWLGAMVALVVIGINPDKSRLVAVQRGVGTFFGVVLTMWIGTTFDSLWVLLPLVVLVLFLMVLMQTASPLFFTVFLTTTLLLMTGIGSDTPLKLVGGRLVETLIAIGIAIQAIRMLQPNLRPIVTFLQEQAAVRQRRAKEMLDSRDGTLTTTPS